MISSNVSCNCQTLHARQSQTTITDPCKTAANLMVCCLNRAYWLHSETSNSVLLRHLVPHTPSTDLEIKSLSMSWIATFNLMLSLVCTWTSVSLSYYQMSYIHFQYVHGLCFLALQPISSFNFILQRFQLPKTFWPCQPTETAYKALLVSWT